MKANHRNDRRTYLDGGFQCSCKHPKSINYTRRSAFLNGAFILGALVVLLTALDMFYFVTK